MELSVLYWYYTIPKGGIVNNIIAAQLFINRLRALLENHKERVSFDPRNQKTQQQEGNYD